MTLTLAVACFRYRCLATFQGVLVGFHRLAVITQLFLVQRSNLQPQTLGIFVSRVICQETHITTDGGMPVFDFLVADSSIVRRQSRILTLRENIRQSFITESCIQIIFLLELNRCSTQVSQFRKVMVRMGGSEIFVPCQGLGHVAGPVVTFRQIEQGTWSRLTVRIIQGHLLKGSGTGGIILGCKGILTLVPINIRRQRTVGVTFEVLLHVATAAIIATLNAELCIFNAGIVGIGRHKSTKGFDGHIILPLIVGTIG